MSERTRPLRVESASALRFVSGHGFQPCRMQSFEGMSFRPEQDSSATRAIKRRGGICGHVGRTFLSDQTDPNA
jgi:hypothetical protein